jgi:hypothetical protein
MPWKERLVVPSRPLAVRQVLMVYYNIGTHAVSSFHTLPSALASCLSLTKHANEQPQVRRNTKQEEQPFWQTSSQ